MHDTVEFEQRGIPATVVITRAFRNAAEFQFRSRGMAQHPFIVLPHPVSNLGQAEMRALTRRFIEPLVRQITA